MSEQATINRERLRAYLMVMGFAHGKGSRSFREKLIELAILIRDDLPKYEP